jgi:hypothetical protein
MNLKPTSLATERLLVVRKLGHPADVPVSTDIEKLFYCGC